MPSGLEKAALNGEQRQSQQLGSKRLNNMGEGREGQEVTGGWRKLRGDDGDERDRTQLYLWATNKGLVIPEEEGGEEVGGILLVFPCRLGRSNGVSCVLHYCIQSPE